jgi:hypothetical protein
VNGHGAHGDEVPRPEGRRMKDWTGSDPILWMTGVLALDAFAGDGIASNSFVLPPLAAAAGEGGGEGLGKLQPPPQSFRLTPPRAAGL